MPDSAKYIRFVCDRRHPTINAELGMFALIDDIELSLFRGSLQRQFEEAWYWFKPSGGGGLYRPNFRGKRRTYEVRKSLYWFKQSATFTFYQKNRVVVRARQLADALRAM